VGAIAQLGVGDRESTVTNYLASLLSAVASLALALLMPTFLLLVRDLAAQHAPGLTVLTSGVLERFLSLRFVVFFLLFFSYFHLARQSLKPGLRILLFWIPAAVVTALGFALWAYLVYVMRLIAQF
jgi:hypothetical protein